MVSRADQTFSEIRYLGSRAGVRTGNVCRKIFPQLAFGFRQEGAVLGEPHLVQRYSVGTLMLPKNRDQKGIVPGYQGQCPDRRFHFPVAMGHVGVLFGRLAQCTTQWDFNRKPANGRRGGAERYRPDGWPPASRHAVAPLEPRPSASNCEIWEAICRAKWVVIGLPSHGFGRGLEQGL